MLLFLLVFFYIRRLAFSLESFGDFVECRSSKQEKYSAAWLVSSALLRALPESYLGLERLEKPGTMMEGASFLVFEGNTVFKSVDLLDFYVEHLSWYERRLRKVAPTEVVAEVLKSKTQRKRHLLRKNNILAVMPFYAAGAGQGPSSVSLRLPYLKATLASVSFFAEKRVVAVQNDRDYKALESMGLWDVLLLPVANPNKLGVATLIALHRLLRNGLTFGSSRRSYADYQDIDYVYYTESDQILRMRSLRHLLKIVDANPKRNVLVPRRVLPLPVSRDFDPSHTRLQASEELRTNSKSDTHDGFHRSQRCCFSGDLADACKQVDLIDRSTFAERNHSLLRPSPEGFALLPAEGNFLKMLFRPCLTHDPTPTTRGGCLLKKT